MMDIRSISATPRLNGILGTSPRRRTPDRPTIAMQSAMTAFGRYGIRDSFVHTQRRATTYDAANRSATNRFLATFLGIVGMAAAGTGLGRLH